MDKIDKIIIFTLCFYLCSAKIKINRLDVPSAILFGSQNDVILDCDFDSGGDQVTEIKWFKDGDTQIYQWLPNTETKARAIGKLKNHIDVNYMATDDANTMHRALHLTDLSPEFSGNYTCKVSGPASEDVETKSMIIYVTPDDNAEDDDFDDEILDLEISEETSEITCTAGGYYPQPNMTLYIINDNETEITFRQDDEIVTKDEDGFFNVTSVLKYDSENLTQNFEYICELNLPGTPYNISESGIHVQEDSSETQVEEDSFNTTNSTESSFEGSPVLYTETETQIEEEFISTTSETAINDDDDDDDIKEETIIEENASVRHLPSLFWIASIMGLLSALYF